MLVVMKNVASAEEIEAVVGVIQEMGYDARPIPGGQRTAVGIIGNDGGVDAGRLQGLGGVLEVIPVTHPYKQVSREWQEEDTVVSLANGTSFGGSDIAVIAGPCAVESEPAILDIAHQLKEMGDIYKHGIAANRDLFEMTLDFYEDQGQTSRRLSIEEVFAADTLDT